MREILFRGKTRNNEWVEGLYLTYDPKHYDCLENPSHVIVNNPEAIGCGLCIQESEMTGKNLSVYSDTVGQYTGLTDKNGTKIFEGDVVKAVLPPEDMRNGFEWMPGMVSYAEGAFGIAYSKHNFVPFRSFASSVRFEVIGNIHDNPELLEVRHGWLER